MGVARHDGQDALPDEGDGVGKEDAVLQRNEEEVREGWEGPDGPVGEHDAWELGLEIRGGSRQRHDGRDEGLVEDEGEKSDHDLEDEEKQRVHRGRPDGLVQEKLDGDGSASSDAAVKSSFFKSRERSVVKMQKWRKVQ